MLFKAIAATLFASAASLAFADAAIWDYNGQAVAAGQGCNSRGPMADTFFVAAGEEISIVFSQMGVNLGDEYAPNGVRTNCSVRIPVQIARGRYIGELTQTFLYGVTKTPGTMGSVSARATFFDLPAARMVHQFRQGQRVDEPLIERTLHNDYRVQADSWCLFRRSLTGEYKLNIAISGQRNSPYESIIVQMDGADIKFEAIAGFYNCNL